MKRLSSHPGPALTLAGVACLALLAAPVAAQTMKPGLWEITNRMGGSGDMGAKMAAAQEQMQQAMASMSPEQRKQMEKMMAQQGMSMTPGAGGGMSTRICVTKEMAARNEAPAQHQGDCKQEQMQRSGNTTRFKFICSKPPSTGEGEVTVHSPESYTMKMNMTRQEKGRAEQMTMDAQGRWLGSDCGNIRPAKG
jgi:hypothetical protein